MGLFDTFYGLGNLSPEQSQGLLAAATSLLKSGGPSHIPVGTGQALGDAIGAFQGGVDAATQLKQQRLFQQQMGQLNAIKLRDAQADFDNQQMLRDRAKNLQEFYKGDASRTGNTPSPSEPLTSLSGRAPLSTNDQLLQKIQNMQGPMYQLGAGQRAYQQRLAQADRLRAAGFGQEADAAEDRALKFMPKVKGWEKVLQDGKAMFAPYFEDGTSGAPVPLEVAQQLEKVDTGGRVDLINSFTGVTTRSLPKSATPDARLSALTARRGQDITDARGRETNQINQGIRADAQAQKVRDENLTKQGQIAGFDTMLDSLDRLSAHPGLTRSVGLYSKAPTIPGSDSANFQAELETFKSQAFLPQVAQLKGMGALSDAEGRKLTAAVGALDPGMSESAFRTSIARIKDTMDAARTRVVASSRSDVQQGFSPAPQQYRKSALRGQVIDGYRFKGGDPSQEINWEKL